MDKHQALSQYFGYTEFRPGQESLIDAVLSGRDVFGIMPTGGGKSMCYQLPALLLPGITFVVSPLISLMHDQVMSLKAAGIPAAYLNSSLSPAQMHKAYHNLLLGMYKIVYIAPERLDYGGFSAVAEKLPISFVAVDEAHCISQWGQDFRPSYLRILKFIDQLPKRPVVGAFTATATQQVRQDVERILSLQNPVRAVTGFDRPNLYFEVMQPSDKDEQLLRLVGGRRQKSGIVYCSTRNKVEAVCELLQNHGFQATRYHAGLSEQERQQNQQDFLYDVQRIMVATNAFGMGIDKSNVHFVIHYNMPKSIEAYYQEAGRAGRDGADAECILLYNGSDVAMGRYLIEHGNSNEELTPEQKSALRQQELGRLEDMTRYCKTDRCLRGYILDYFGQNHPQLCGNCSTCKGGYEEKEITEQAQMVLSCIQRLYHVRRRWSDISLVAKVLQGFPDATVRQEGLQQLPTYGLMRELGRTEIRAVADQLEQEGCLTTDWETQEVSLTEQAQQVLFGHRPVYMLVRRAVKNLDQELTPAQSELYEALCQVRAQLARKESVPPDGILTDLTMVEMAKKQPKNTTQFRRLSGVGELKAQWYAAGFLKVIKNFLREQQSG